ncbi:DUF4166 domain-containing protein [Ruegeria meonggei]|uniref:DUF4166 domain-containing protein n=1 Tax=Ruegeria meonggei TaxID=1446476 RepID=A0A1X6YTU3_9RHOB|nr:DUF4166 domain-containing protein [Ruegeria meonggei]SLN31276.1 hypothetical protein RUM8411_01297 [Ruegeria meonggei]
MQPDPFLQALPEDSELPMAVRRLHGNTGLYSGRCDVRRGRGLLIDLMLRLGRFPLNAEDIPVQVRIERNGHEWTWQRDFNGHTTCSRLIHDHETGSIREKLGWVTLWLKPEVSDGRILIHIRRLSVLGLPCPAFLLPRSSTAEWQGEDGHFWFDVSAEVPMLGRLIRYRGWLTPVHAEGHCD